MPLCVRLVQRERDSVVGLTRKRAPGSFKGPHSQSPLERQRKASWVLLGTWDFVGSFVCVCTLKPLPALYKKKKMLGFVGEEILSIAHIIRTSSSIGDAQREQRTNSKTHVPLREHSNSSAHGTGQVGGGPGGPLSDFVSIMPSVCFDW